MRRAMLFGLLVTRLALVIAVGCASVDDYVGHLDHPDARVREKAALKLTRAGRRAVTPIVLKLTEAVATPTEGESARQEPACRQRAFYVLGRIGPQAKEAVPALGEALRSPGSGRGDAESRHVAAWALGRIGKAAFGEIAQGLRHENPEVRASSARAVGFVGPHAKRLVPELARLMEDEDPAVRLAAVESAGAIGPWAKAAVPALMRLLDEPLGEAAGDEREEGEHDPLCAAAFEALGLIGAYARRAVPDLAGLLAHGDADVRAAAARTLGRIGPHAADAAGPLGQALADEDAGVRLESMLALVAIGSVPRSATCDFLKALAEYGTAFEDRAYGEARVAAILGRFAKRHTPALIELAGDQDREARRRAVRALGTMPPTRHTLPTVVRALEDADAAVRLEAVKGLGRAGPAARRHALAVGMMLKDPDPAVRRAAAAAGRILGRE